MKTWHLVRLLSSTIAVCQPEPLKTFTDVPLRKMGKGVGSCIIHSIAFVEEGFGLKEPSFKNLPISLKVLADT